MKPNAFDMHEEHLKERLQELGEASAKQFPSREGIKRRFLSRVSYYSHKTVTNGSPVRHSSWIPFLKKERIMSTVVSLLLALGLLLGGTTATVYAAQDDLPNQMLYPVKLLTENLQSDFTTNPVEKLDLALQFAETRIDEIVQLQSEGAMPPEAVYANLEMQIQRSIELATQQGETNLEAALLQIRDRLQTKLMLLDGSAETPTLLRTRTLLQERIQLVETGLGNLNGFYLEAQNGWENTPLMNEGETTQNQQQINMGGEQPTTAGNSEVTPGPQGGNDQGTGSGTQTGGSSTSKTPVHNGTGGSSTRP
jgi:hypothetical protein